MGLSSLKNGDCNSVLKSVYCNCLVAALLLLLLAPFAGAAPIGMIRTLNTPIIAAANSNSTLHSRHAMNPSIVLFNGTYYLYFRSENGSGTQSFEVWTASATGFNGTTWNQNPVTQPIFSNGSYIADPCAVVYNNQVYLYYMGADGGTYLLTSSDGLHFTSQGHILDTNNQNAGGGNPCAFVNSTDGRLYLFVGWGNAYGNGWRYRVMSSSDGLHFTAPTDALSPSYLPGTFDAQSIVTLRIYKEGSYYYAIYGAAGNHDDYNEGFGLARSTDLVNWTKYPKNPFFLRGPAGSGDEGAVWSGSLIKVGSTYYMYYEGCGSNAGAGTSASNTARSTQYGGWASTNFSQIWLATSTSLNLTDWDANGGLTPSATYKIVSQANTSQLLDVNGGSQSNGAQLFVGSATGNVRQTWQFTPNAGFYSASNVAGGPSGYQVWDVSGAGVTSGTAIGQWPSWGGANQQWQIVPVGSGIYAFKDRNSGMVLDLSSGYGVLNPWTGANTQKWSLQSASTNVVSYTINPGFEASGAGASPLAWSVWTGNNTAPASFTETGSHGGSYRLTHYSGSPFQVYTYQNLYGIPNGTYTLSVWVVGGGGQNQCFLSAKNFGGSGELTANVIPSEVGWPNWRQVTISNITVTNNSVTIGAYTNDTTGGHWVSFDDFQLIPQ